LSKDKTPEQLKKLKADGKDIQKILDKEDIRGLSYKDYKPYPGSLKGPAPEDDP
jgi:hypothetical protein